jgi:hypothetical protein
MLNVNASWKCLTCVPFHVTVWDGIGSFSARDKRCTSPSGLQVLSMTQVMICWTASKRCTASQTPSTCNQFEALSECHRQLWHHEGQIHFTPTSRTPLTCDQFVTLSKCHTITVQLKKVGATSCNWSFVGNRTDQDCVMARPNTHKRRLQRRTRQSIRLSKQQEAR